MLALTITINYMLISLDILSLLRLFPSIFSFVMQGGERVSLSPLPSFVLTHSLTPLRLSAQSDVPINVFAMVTVVVPKEGRRKIEETKHGPVHPTY